MNIQSMADSIRFLALDTIVAAGEGHQGVPLGMAEIAATLYANHLKVDPKNPLWPDRDRVVLSNGHGSMLLYALLHLSGYEKVDLAAVKSFRKLHSVCAGHPEIEQDAGIEITTGLLGQGIACAVGMAVAEERMRAEFGADLCDHRTWAFVGDGCLQEGIGQEAISLAGHLRLGRLTFLWDDNHITDDGDTALSISEDIPARFTAAGWHVVEVDGHDIAAIDTAILSAKSDPRPSLIACRTTIARGIPRLQGQRGGHSAPLSPKDAAEARAARNWAHEAFVIPQDIYADWTAAMSRSRDAARDWAARLKSDPKAAEFTRRIEGVLPQNWPQIMADIEARLTATDAARATIASSGDVCEGLEAALPELCILCADLEAPTNHKRGRAAFGPENRHGSYVHCGVREHLMGAMACGIAAHGGLIAVNVTYLAFADYERPAMRMAALMGLPVLFVFSHDSIGVGSNGPTHQPVEILASFRAMPNFWVMRPADARETVMGWDQALRRKSGPTLLALSRQDLAPLPQISGCANGGYILAGEDPRDITLIATGSEVALALDAAAQLQRADIRATVVSLPCWEIFETQSPAQRAAILGTGPKIGIEAAVRFGWDQILAPEDPFIGMTGFGASAKAPELFAHFGITTEAIVAAAKARLSR